MSKFKQLIKSVLKEWGNYPDGFDDSILDGDPAEEGDWLDESFAVKVFAGQYPNGTDFSEEAVIPSYVAYFKESKDLDLVEDLIQDGPTTKTYDQKTGKFFTHEVTYYSVFYTKEKAEQILARFEKEFLNVKAEIVEVYGYGNNEVYYEDPSEAIEAYIDDYKEAQYYAGIDD